MRTYRRRRSRRSRRLILTCPCLSTMQVMDSTAISGATTSRKRRPKPGRGPSSSCASTCVVVPDSSRGLADVVLIGRASLRAWVSYLAAQVALEIQKFSLSRCEFKYRIVVIVEKEVSPILTTPDESHVFISSLAVSPSENSVCGEFMGVDPSVNDTPAA